MSAKIQNSRNTIFYRKLFSLVLPIAFQQFMLAAVSASDALMLGVISQDALSAVSLAGQITFVFNLFMGGLTLGTSVLAAQYYGKGDRESIEKIFGYVTRLSVLISVVFFVPLFLRLLCLCGYLPAKRSLFRAARAIFALCLFLTCLRVSHKFIYVS